MSDRGPEFLFPGELDERTERFLWDPGAPPTDELVAIEGALAPLRHRARSMDWPEVPRRRPVGRWLAAAALALVLGGAAVAAWLWSWPTGKAWPVLQGPAAVLLPGEPVRVGEGESLAVRVARIGWMRVEGDAQLRLVSTASNRHRVALEEGSLRAGIWAPPGSFGILTPAGRVLDLGCEFSLQIEGGRAEVGVVSGWVQLENGAGESIVPAGARASMRAGEIPSVPVYDDSDPRFRLAVRSLEAGRDPSSLREILSAARPRDVYTLLVLATREPDAREPLLRRAAELHAPPSADLFGRALTGDRQATWTWIDDLPLPPPKRWLPNWRDWWPG